MIGNVNVSLTELNSYELKTAKSAFFLSISLRLEFNEVY